ncbi:MAG: RNB domain-containing ribonuclease, partial [Acidobacteriales bacterium]|nr:RNB domain-containing ribonuclease [Terriglobales bacterium]
MSCIMEIDHQGEVLGYELHQGVIRSAARMTYNKVQRILDGDTELRHEYAALVPEFQRMETLARILNRRRERRGAIDFDLPEPVIEFDEQGVMQGVTRSSRLFAHRLIEEFMLIANECVAQYLEDRRIHSIYRVHEKPDPKKVFEFEVLAASFGYSLGIGAIPIKKINMRGERRENQRRGRGRQTRTHEIPQDIHITPKMYQKLTAKIAGKPEEQILSYLMLRSLKQARYLEKNEGHFALAAPTYTHFTSPIRRYPDLIIHRLLKEAMRSADPQPAAPHSPHSQATDKRKNPEIEIIPEAELRDIAEHSSETERAADDAERELIEWKKAKFMIERIGEEFPGLIVSVTKFGFFVELFDLFVEGLVPLQTLTDDRYTFHENTRQIIGERWGKIYSLGDRVRVLVDKVDPMSHKINFAVVEDDRPKTRPKRKKSMRQK